MSIATSHVGQPVSRVDARAKVTGTARYAAEFTPPDLAHGYLVMSAIARGRITRLDASAARALPGVIEVFSHENRPREAWFDFRYRDEVAPPGSPFRPLYSDEIQFSGQPVALIVAETFEIARHAASLVTVDYAPAPHQTDLDRARAEAYVPPKKRTGIPPPPKPRGHPEQAFDAAPVKVANEYRIAAEHHNPIEPHATTVVWEAGGRITIHDKIQGPQNTQAYVTGVFGLSERDVRVVAPFVGGAFGSGLRPHFQLFLAVMAALVLRRSVRVELTRDQMFALGNRPETINTVRLGAAPDGGLLAIRHDAVAHTSQYEDYQETVVNWSGLLYHCDNVALTYELAKTDIATPLDMRAPGAPLGLFAMESALDELSYALGIDPLALRLRNYTETDENDGTYYTSKELRAAYQLGAERFGWSRRQPAPRSMREGRELIGWGMATGAWEASMMKTTARAVLSADGRLTVATATADIGTGTYTILSQIAADVFGMPIERVVVNIGDSALPHAPVEGGSWTAASAGSAVHLACAAVRERLFRYARRIDGSPIGNAEIGHVIFAGDRITLAADPGRYVSFAAAMQSAGVTEIAAEETAAPSKLTALRYTSYTHSAVFAEVRVDEELGLARVSRIVDAVAAGRIINPKTARSQIIGGVVFALGMALQEESLLDHRLGRFMNHNLSEYHVPVHADMPEIDIIFIDEHEDRANPLGVKGLGEIGVVGTAAAITNAIYHATGKRIRSLPATIDKLLD